MIVFCSQCGIQKKLVNHWWLFWVERSTRLCISPFDDEPSLWQESWVKAACGTACLHKGLEKYAEHIRSGLAVGTRL